MMSLLFAYVVFSSILLFDLAAVVAIDVFLKSLTTVSTHRQRHVASDTEFKQDSPNSNLDSDSLTECTFLLNPHSDSL